MFSKLSRSLGACPKECHDVVYDKYNRERFTSPAEWGNKSITSGVASKKGVYNNFSGLVDWKGSRFSIEGGTFEITGVSFHGGLNVLSGTITDGIVEEAVVQYCVFQNGEVENVWWMNGTFKNGIWKSGRWFDGVWEGGKWEKGRWAKGYDKSGKLHTKNDSPDKWQ